MAQKTWEMSNNVETVGSVDEIYRFDKRQQDDILTAKPWDKEYIIIIFYSIRETKGVERGYKYTVALQKRTEKIQL